MPISAHLGHRQLAVKWPVVVATQTVPELEAEIQQRLRRFGVAILRMTDGTTVEVVPWPRTPDGR